MRKKIITLTFILLIVTSSAVLAQQFQLNASGYFSNQGVDVMAFNDFYPEGHQGGVSVLMNGHRIATNGDIRMEATPGQWQPVPKQLNHNNGWFVLRSEIAPGATKGAVKWSITPNVVPGTGSTTDEP